MIKGIIFDVDGTLLDSMRIWTQLGERYLNTKGIQAEPGLNKILYPMTLDESSAYLKEKYAIADIEDKITTDTIKIIEDFYLYEAKLKPGVKSFLDRMKEKNIPMIVATSSDKDMIVRSFENLGISDFFIDIVTCTELKMSKRTPGIYLYCAELLKTQPSQTIVFEDVLHAVKSAKEGGFITYAVEDFSSFDDEAQIRMTCDCYIKDFIEVDI